MKNENFKSRLSSPKKMIVACFLLFFVGIGGAFAQEFISESEAMPVISNQVEELETELSDTVEGSTAYYELKLKLALYNHVYEGLLETDFEMNDVIREKSQEVTSIRSKFSPSATSNDVAVLEYQLRSLLSN